MLSAELINDCNFKVYVLTSLWYYVRTNHGNQRLESLVNG